MVPYEASTRVPLVIAGPGIVHAEFDQATSLIDLCKRRYSLGLITVKACRL